MNTAIALKHVSHRFNDIVTLDKVTFSIARGECVALLGPSGAGKSTLLSLLDGRLNGWDGFAEVLDISLSSTNQLARSERADVGFIFQEFALVDRLTVYQNVMNGRLGRTRTWPSLWGRFNERDHVVVSGVLQETGLADLASRRADQLSGGQRQRVAIARCLAQEPQVILADEPVNSIDPAHAERILGLITGFAKKCGIGVIFSSHQPDLSLRFADRAIGIREGSILFDHPVSQITAEEMSRLYTGTITRPELRVVS